jgi:hypothetical protein
MMMSVEQSMECEVAGETEVHGGTYPFAIFPTKSNTLPDLGKK